MYLVEKNNKISLQLYFSISINFRNSKISDKIYSEKKGMKNTTTIPAGSNLNSFLGTNMDLSFSSSDSA